MTLKTILMTTATPIERQMGRFMRAPDHGDAGGATPPADAGQSTSGEPAKEESRSTQESLEAEFDNHEDEDGDAASSGDANEDDDDDYDDDDDESSEADGDEETDESDSDDSADQKSKKKSRAQERIDELTSYGRSKEREAQLLREEVVRLGGNPDAVGEEAAPEEPDPSKYEYGEHDVDYIRERAKYDAKMEMLEERAKATFKAQAAELDAKWTKNQVEAHKKYPDFDEVVVKGAQENKWPCPPVVAVSIKDSDVGPDVAYHLASNPQEAERIAKLTPLEQAREFGNLEERLRSKAARAQRREQQSSKVTKAPKPPKRHIRGKGAKKPTNFDTDDFRSFERAVDANKMIRTQ